MKIVMLLLLYLTRFIGVYVFADLFLGLFLALLFTFYPVVFKYFYF